ncbi:MAG: gliding motility protein GldN [Bacteroidales bacterium]|nr:gliding motility protein GldN [Bacteroidales bacterium]
MKKLIVIIALLGFFFAPELSAQFLNDESSTGGLYAENTTGVKKPMPQPSIREADVMWKKTVWREIDFRQKMNQGFYFPVTPQGNWKNLYTILMDALEEGIITAYNANINVDSKGDFKEKMTFNEIIKQHERETKYSTENIKVEDVTRCLVKEIWYFDKQRSQLMVRTLAICPIEVREVERLGKIEKQSKTLFWVPYNDETRQLLVQQPYHNRSNTAAQLNYDEVFVKRMFDSYIVREENVYDRAINDYAQGIDALKESERIKSSIIDFEQNLWEY